MGNNLDIPIRGQECITSRALPVIHRIPCMIKHLESEGLIPYIPTDGHGPISIQPHQNIGNPVKISWLTPLKSHKIPYSSMIVFTSEATVVAMFQHTILPEAGSVRPRGNVQHTPTEAKVPFQRRRKMRGTVGEVDQAIAPLQTEAGSPGSSAWNNTFVGVTAAA
jgi:hypothetical protein